MNQPQIVTLLQIRYPDALVCEPGKMGMASGLVIRVAGREAYAFLYESQDRRPQLLSLYDGPDDKSPEVWQVGTAQELAERIAPWAFPKPWKAPEPVDAARERKRLERTRNGLAGRCEGARCIVGGSHPEVERYLSARGKECLARDLGTVDEGRVLEYFPWDGAGRLALNTLVLLAKYETDSPPAQGRDICLAAVGPQRRSDAAVISVKLLDLIEVNQTHRWDRCRWRWTGAAVPLREHLGISAERFAEQARKGILGGEGTAGPAEQNNELFAMAPVEGANPTAKDNDKARRSLELLEAGLMDEALALYGVALSERAHRLLGAERIKPNACCAHPDQEWTELLVDTLRASAPWLLPCAVAEEAARIGRWAAEKKGRKRRAVILKLAIFPGQHHSRKACLVLAGGIDGSRPTIDIETTASNARLHDTGWRRSIAVDMERRGM